MVRFTLEYAAPEVAARWEAGSSQERVGAKVDVWALGLIAYELLTKRTAFPTSLTEAEVRAPLLLYTVAPGTTCQCVAPPSLKD